MAFIGKEYVYESQENFEEYVEAIGMVEPQASEYVNYTPNVKVEQDGDSYTLSTMWPDYNTDVTFTSGEEIESDGEVQSTTTYTLEDDTLTTVQTFESGAVLTTVMEFTEDSMVETYTTNTWEGSATRTYTAV